MIIIQISISYFQSSHSKKKGCVQPSPPAPLPASSILKNLSPRFYLCGDGEGGGRLYVKPATDLGQTGKL